VGYEEYSCHLAFNFEAGICQHISMIIVGPGECEEAAIRRLVAEMLCLEHGARALKADLTPEPEPHAPWPILRVPPRTRRGVAYTIHYRPSVGVVYTDVPFDQFTAAVLPLLHAAGVAHLLRFRAVEATMGVTIRAEPQLPPTTVIRSSGNWPSIRGNKSCARLIFRHTGIMAGIPYFSTRAAFMWVIEPTHQVSQTEGSSLGVLNAGVAGIVYDRRIPGLARSLDPGPLRFQTVLPPKLNGLRLACPLVHGGGTLTYGGHAAPFSNTEAWSALPLETSPDLDRKNARCICCAAPVGGKAVVLRRICGPTDNHGGPVWSSARVPLSPRELICGICWMQLPPGCVEHLGALAYQTTLPWSQAGACDTGSALATLLAGTPTPTHVPGVVRVTTAAGDILLIGNNLDAHRLAIWAAGGNIPTIEGVDIIEARPA